VSIAFLFRDRIRALGFDVVRYPPLPNRIRERDVNLVLEVGAMSWRVLQHDQARFSLFRSDLQFRANRRFLQNFLTAMHGRMAEFRKRIDFDELACRSALSASYRI
jgi:hypothetical protein